ncbi:MAG: hypothetical protein AB1847_05780 [bacterium]
MAQRFLTLQDTSQQSEEAIQKAFNLGGQIKLDHSLFARNEKAGLYRLKYSSEEEKSSGLADQVQMQLWGKHDLEEIQFSWKVRSSAQSGNLEAQEENPLEEACITWQSNPEFRWYAGKKVLSWGSGHAFKPLAFLDTPEDPLDRDEPHNGLLFFGAEYAKVFPPGPDPLQGVTFTPLIFPVQEKINEEFGQPEHWNMAGRLSLLFWNTDIDFVALKGESRPERYGCGFSRKIYPFLEIYADCWTSPQYEKVFIDQSGELWKTRYTAFCSFGGVRYEKDDMCCVVEYYRNKGGFTPEEMYNYYHYLQSVVDDTSKKNADQDKQRMVILSDTYYQHPNLAQEYAYLQILKKEPLKVRRLSFSIAGIWNVQDQSYSLSPVIQYKAKPNLMIGLKGTFHEGDPCTEFGEKINTWSVEVSLTYSLAFSLYYAALSKEPRQQEDPSRPERPYRREELYHQSEPPRLKNPPYQEQAPSTKQEKQYQQYRQEQPYQQEKPHRQVEPPQQEQPYRQQQPYRQETPYRQVEPTRQEEQYQQYRQEQPYQQEKPHRQVEPARQEEQHQRYHQEEPYQQEQPYRQEEPNPYHQERQPYQEDRYRQEHYQQKEPSHREEQSNQEGGYYQEEQHYQEQPYRQDEPSPGSPGTLR